MHATTVNGDRKFGWKSLTPETYDPNLCADDPKYEARLPTIQDKDARRTLHDMLSRSQLIALFAFPLNLEMLITLMGPN